MKFLADLYSGILEISDLFGAIPAIFEHVPCWDTRYVTLTACVGAWGVCMYVLFLTDFVLSLTITTKRILTHISARMRHFSPILSVTRNSDDTYFEDQVAECVCVFVACVGVCVSYMWQPW
eukprot:GDKI01025191.1.p1 GENE.GDKI01025191.1~~GDKI01025191.1.p1  ORF type:complete len:141 (+),score=36.69 GDKI01025191.1:62-424(+)